MTAMISDCPSAAHPNGKQPARPGGQGASRQIRGIRPRRRPAQADHPATAAPTPLLDGLGPTRVWVAAAFLLGVIAREVLGGPEAAGRALQHARRTRPGTGPVPPPPAARAARPPSPAPQYRRKPDRLGRGPAGRRGQANHTTARTGTPPPGPHPRRDPGAALPADQPVRAGDCRTAVPVGAHRQDPPAAPVPKARRAHPDPGCPASPRPRPPRSVLPQALTASLRSTCRSRPRHSPHGAFGTPIQSPKLNKLNGTASKTRVVLAQTTQFGAAPWGRPGNPATDHWAAVCALPHSSADYAARRSPFPRWPSPGQVVPISRSTVISSCAPWNVSLTAWASGSKRGRNCNASSSRSMVRSSASSSSVGRRVFLA
jgi:hypothetical protein